ncbi:hypothetical protein [Rhizohabitans arisaemae]|uniref:hypothetical protein n=1 Tax=Rhizohabitans arisaemae TaxID=2720610 RepID=UPI0024B1E93A|nr:hypothetical protein [Rhizohabitans arisaemae]
MSARPRRTRPYSDRTAESPHTTAASVPVPGDDHASGRTPNPGVRTAGGPHAESRATTTVLPPLAVPAARSVSGHPSGRARSRDTCTAHGRHLRAQTTVTDPAHSRRPVPGRTPYREVRTAEGPHAEPLATPPSAVPRLTACSASDRADDRTDLRKETR